MNHELASSPSEAPPRRSSRPIARASACVLVVDDDPTQRKLNAARIRDAGMQVHTAADAKQALEVARRVRPDLILSDVIMGEVDGFAFCQQVRRDPMLDRIPVVLISSHFDGQCDRKLAQMVGADALIQRTPTFEAELAQIDRTLRGDTAVAPPEASDEALQSLYSRTVAGQLTRMAHDSKTTELKYLALFEHANDGIAVLDPDGTILEINRRWEEILRCPREQIVGHHIREFAAPGHEQENVARFQQARERSTGSVEVFAIARADGTIANLEISEVMVDIDGTANVLTITRDVTETVEAQRKLEQSEQKYRSLVENIPDVVWSVDTNGKATFIGPSLLKTCGFTPEELMAHQTGDSFARVHPEDRERVQALFVGLLRDGIPLDAEYRTRHKDGSWRWLHNRALPVRDAEGRVERIDGIFFDVTERHELEEQVRRSQKMEALGQLTGGVAHDFNNILAVILANSHFLLEDLRPGDPRREDAEEIRQAAERAVALTRQLLAFSRQQVVTPVELSPDDVVLGIKNMLRRLMREDVELVIDASSDCGKVHMDAGQLEQVVMNLAVNARDAMPDGGALRIELQPVAIDAQSHVGCENAEGGLVPAGRYVRLSVCDTGCGMDASVKRRIFEPFFTTKGPGKGTGLGLSTCYGIVKQSHGFIAVDTTPGKGTTFHVYLPQIEAACAPQAAPRAARAPSLGRETVLLVEDDDALRKSVERILRARGYRVLIAGSGSEAINQAAVHARGIDVLLSDVVLSDINGFEVAERVRQLAPKAKVVLMSGYTDHALFEQRAPELDLVFLHKPLAPHDLALKLREALDA